MSSVDALTKGRQCAVAGLSRFANEQPGWNRSERQRVPALQHQQHLAVGRGMRVANDKQMPPPLHGIARAVQTLDECFASWFEPPPQAATGICLPLRFIGIPVAAMAHDDAGTQPILCSVGEFRGAPQQCDASQSGRDDQRLWLRLHPPTAPDRSLHRHVGKCGETDSQRDGHCHRYRMVKSYRPAEQDIDRPMPQIERVRELADEYRTAGCAARGQPTRPTYLLLTRLRWPAAIPEQREPTMRTDRPVGPHSKPFRV